jgi:hypothetical protein
MATAIKPESYLHDGTVFDLTIPWVDVIGVEWRWTGQRNEAAEPLMQANDERGEAPISLPDLYRDHGPLIPVHGKPRIDRTSWWMGGVA